MPTWRAAVTAARPLVQKWACTTSGTQSPSRQRSSSQRANSPMKGSSGVGRDDVGRAGRHVHDLDPARRGHLVGHRRVVAAGVDADLVPDLGERGGQVGDMGLLAAVTQGAGVLGNHRDAHVVPPGGLTFAGAHARRPNR